MKLIFRVVILLVIAIALIYCWQNQNIRTAFFNFDIIYLPLICLYYLLFYGLNAFAIYILANKSSEEVRFLQVLGISQFSSLVGYTLPFRIANIGVRAAYLKSRFNIPYGETIGGGLLVTVMSLAISGITIVIFGINYLHDIIDGQYWLLISFLLCICAVLTTLYIFRNSLNTYLTTHFPKLESLKRGVTQLSSFDLILLFLVTLSAFLLIAFINQALINGVGMNASLSACLVLAAAGTLSFLIAIAPANLGTKELFYVGIGALYGLDPEGVIAFLIIDRLVQITFLTVSSTLFYFSKNKSKKSL